MLGKLSLIAEYAQRPQINQHFAHKTARRNLADQFRCQEFGMGLNRAETKHTPRQYILPHLNCIQA